MSELSGSLFLADAAATEAMGAHLATLLKAPCIVFLEGELGAGKTTLIRGFLRGLGYAGSVKSPTYTLVEIYPLASVLVYHFDLYRLSQAEELEFMGIRDYFVEPAIVFVEWPERGLDFLPRPNLTIELKPENQGRRLVFKS